MQKLEYEAQVRAILSRTDKTSTESHPTVFHSLRDDPDLPSSEKSLSRLVMEAQSLIGAGTLTSTHMLSITTYHILANPPILSKLLEELEKAIPNIATPCPLQTLEQLPYLSAVISEGLRVSYGTVHRLQRVHPDNTLIFRDWIIPPGTPVSMSSLSMHDDQSIFPEPRKFDPERWLGPGPERDLRLKYLFSFGRGARQCVGMNLAEAEMHMALAMVFRSLGRRMELFNTESERDVDVKYAFMVTNPGMDSRGVRVIFRGDKRER